MTSQRMFRAEIEIAIVRRELDRYDREALKRRVGSMSPGTFHDMVARLGFELLTYLEGDAVQRRRLLSKLPEPEQPIFLVCALLLFRRAADLLQLLAADGPFGPRQSLHLRAVGALVLMQRTHPRVWPYDEEFDPWGNPPQRPPAAND